MKEKQDQKKYLYRILVRIIQELQTYGFLDILAPNMRSAIRKAQYKITQDGDNLIYIDGVERIAVIDIK
jgi:hypothetical protein